MQINKEPPSPITANHNQDLIDAVGSGDIVSLKRAIRAGAELDTRDHLLRTPLIIAASKGHVNILVELLKNGADKKAVDVSGNNVLFTAIIGERSLGTVHELLRQGVEVNAPGPRGATALLIALRHNNIDVAEELLNNGANPNIRDEKCFSALSYAGWLGKEAIVKLILTKGGKLDSWEMGLALLAAISQAQPNLGVIEMLLETGIDPNFMSMEGNTPLMAAARNGNADTTSLMLQKGAFPNIENKEGETALKLAIMVGSRETTRVLIDGGADIAFRDVNGNTPLHHAAMQGTNECVTLLLRHGAKVEARNKLGRTPLHEAAERGNVLMMDTLLRFKANINALDVTHNTPLMLLTFSEKLKEQEHRYARGNAARFLIRNGAYMHWKNKQRKEADLTEIDLSPEKLFDSRFIPGNRAY